MRETWESFDSFRDAVRALLGLGPDAILRWYPPGEFASSRPVNLENGDMLAVSVITWIRGNLEEVRAEQLLDEFADVINAEEPELVESFASLRPELERILYESPADESKRVFRNLETAIVPNLVGVDSAVDLRVYRARMHEDPSQTGLVPVTLLRLAFDEPLGGSVALAFQVSRSVLRQLADEIELCERDIDDFLGEAGMLSDQGSGSRDVG